MVKLDKVLEFINSFAPASLAEDYDNVGLLVGNKDKEVNKVLITLDIDENVVQEAKKIGCELVISHHPLIFSPLKRVTDESSISRTVISLIKNDISLISAHTNFDSVNSGLCDLFFDKIADTKERTSLQGEEENGCGRIAELKSEIILSDILNNIKKEFNLSTVRYVGDVDKRIKKVAVCNGGGADFVYDAYSLGADLYITGDIKYHHARFVYENGMSLVEVPHYNAEIIFCEYLKELLKKQFGNDLDICVTDKNIDIWNQF